MLTDITRFALRESDYVKISKNIIIIFCKLYVCVRACVRAYMRVCVCIYRRVYVFYGEDVRSEGITMTYFLIHGIPD